MSILWRSAGSIVTVAVGVLAFTAAKAPPCPLDVATAWAEDHRAALPVSLSELETYSPTYRRAILHALTVDQRVALWREHLSRFDSDGRLTSAQADTLRQIIAGLESLVAAPTDSALHALDARANAVFGKVLAHEMLYSIGRGYWREQGDAPDCNCNDDWTETDCWPTTGPPEICQVSMDPNWCTYSSWGCGPIFLSRCNGHCEPLPEG